MQQNHLSESHDCPDSVAAYHEGLSSPRPGFKSRSGRSFFCSTPYIVLSIFPQCTFTCALPQDAISGAGRTDIGIDLKSLELDTFSRITGVDDKDLAEKYLDTAWNAVKYLTDNHID